MFLFIFAINSTSHKFTRKKSANFLFRCPKDFKAIHLEKGSLAFCGQSDHRKNDSWMSFPLVVMHAHMFLMIEEIFFIFFGR